LDFLKLSIVVCSLPLLNGCYYLKGAYHQSSLFLARTPIEKVLNDPNVPADDKRKIELTIKAKQFAQEHLGLKATDNYTKFVQLDRPSLSYVVSASPKWELKHHLWWYPFVGKLPYRGYFSEDDAQKLEDELKADNLDTYMRGVSAYSSLGWITDPIYSSMLRYKEYNLVNTIIHETTHATLFIKSSADFNERMAVFVGNKGTELFYLQEEGPDSPTLKLIRQENEDDKTFSEFISLEIKALEAWYKEQTEKDETARVDRIKGIQARFKKEILPKMKTKSYERFSEIELNNARLLNYKTYLQDLSDFEKLFAKMNSDFGKFIDACKSLEKSEKPEAALKDLLVDEHAN
jgi:predicted aminopeptidase